MEADPDGFDELAHERAAALAAIVDSTSAKKLVVADRAPARRTPSGLP
jgi:hypothetical protein